MRVCEKRDLCTKVGEMRVIWKVFPLHTEEGSFVVLTDSRQAQGRQTEGEQEHRRRKARIVQDTHQPCGTGGGWLYNGRLSAALWLLVDLAVFGDTGGVELSEER